ncbi:MAG: tetratricopeptide repeat protein, partial [Bacteroidota bacterium]
ELQPNTIEPYYQMALFFQNSGQTEKAVTTYNNILDIDPEHKFAVYNLGYINLVYLHNYQAAAEYFTNTIQIDPEYVQAWYNRGYSYELMGNEEFARKDYEKTLDLSRNYPRAIEGLNRLDEQVN